MSGAQRDAQREACAALAAAFPDVPLDADGSGASVPSPFGQVGVSQTARGVWVAGISRPWLTTAAASTPAEALAKVLDAAVAHHAKRLQAAQAAQARLRDGAP